MADSRVGVSYCGLYCPGCGLHENNCGKGKSEANHQKSSAIAKSGATTMFPADDEAKYLGSLRNFIGELRKTLKSCPGCKNGGGPTDCRVQECASDRGYNTCLDCLRLATCDKFQGRSWAEHTLEEIRDIGFEKWLKTKEEFVLQGWQYFEIE
ncbi:MAG: DUF3795 domain-containing protein [Promethearchaeota archaeon]